MTEHELRLERSAQSNRLRDLADAVEDGRIKGFVFIGTDMPGEDEWCRLYALLGEGDIAPQITRLLGAMAMTEHKIIADALRDGEP